MNNLKKLLGGTPELTAPQIHPFHESQSLIQHLTKMPAAPIAPPMPIMPGQDHRVAALRAMLGRK